MLSEACSLLHAHCSLSLFFSFFFFCARSEYGVTVSFAWEVEPLN